MNIKLFITSVFTTSLFLTGFFFLTPFVKGVAPESIPKVEIISPNKAANILPKCIAEKTCIFIDPRIDKDLQRGVLPYSVFYEYPKLNGFAPEELLKAIQNEHYPIQSFKDIRKKNIQIISGCEGISCWRSPELLKDIIQYFEKNNIPIPEIKWVRRGGVPGILSTLNNF